MDISLFHAFHWLQFEFLIKKIVNPFWKLQFWVLPCGFRIVSVPSGRADSEKITAIFQGFT